MPSLSGAGLPSGAKAPSDFVAEMYELKLVPFKAGSHASESRIRGLQGRGWEGVEVRCYCAAARRVSRRLVRVYEEALRPAGVNPAQFELMQHLRARPGLSQGALAVAVDLDQTTLSRNVRGMMAAGWVAVSAGMGDKRVSTYALTEAGMAVLQAAVPLWKEATVRVEAAVGDAEVVWRGLEALEKVV
ncbi:MarR family transcriptional regulator [Granulicella sp. 5B5]|uniref:MarR family winged helix-turn-helix transcriptional regulator n=1 Tax=Granulicella sp. 5B5 TaxID=1617967 RepID=UPI0015F3D0CA|nr:MarR family winged helix-turn-helix transcriptional regulator [Granulicella sp. 5B5]QMV18104.1 MarR family transcriptional regulator [Granulicella sp. 5B5]